jgi:hypothetical protein
MNFPAKHMTARFWGKAAIVAVVFSMSQYVFAIDGTLGGSVKSKSTFSTLKKDLTLSLKSGFSFNGNKSYNTRNQRGMFNSVISYQKGNVTYYLPYKNKPVLQKFRTPAPAVIR